MTGGVRLYAYTKGVPAKWLEPAGLPGRRRVHYRLDRDVFAHRSRVGSCVQTFAHPAVCLGPTVIERVRTQVNLIRNNTILGSE